MTIAGVVWGMLLLNEDLSALAWVAFGVIILGMYLVEPEAKKEELVIRRSFR
jgi:drug/metabolite transporter (DMT)-like permease